MLFFYFSFCCNYFHGYKKFPCFCYSQEKYKKMAGRPGGLQEKVRIPPSTMRVVIGKHERRENGMTAPIYLASTAMPWLIQTSSLDFEEVTSLLFFQIK